jgi:transketolase
VWIWTHDSIGVGEDGPTHQPVEQVASLRAIPNLWVIRPADANETAAAWRVALEREDGPVALILTRQDVPVLAPAGADGVARGAYVLSEPDGGSPDAILVATGSEVALALEAARSLAGEGVTARVVSMPCWELFEAQTQEYRDSVLPPGVTARVSIEAGVSFGWERWIGPAGAAISVERFGASAPGGMVFEQYGLTAGAVVERVRALL